MPYSTDLFYCLLTHSMGLIPYVCVNEFNRIGGSGMDLRSKARVNNFLAKIINFWLIFTQSCYMCNDGWQCLLTIIITFIHFKKI